MDVRELVDRVKRAGAMQALAALKDMARGKEFGHAMVSAILGNLQDWDELFASDEEFCSTYL